MSHPEPFELRVADETLDFIWQRVRDYPWHEMPDDGGWAYGTNLDYLRTFCEYWVNDYDWRAHEAALNAWSHFKVDVGGIGLHYIRERGSGPAPMPLIITHGWPGSVVEFFDLIEPLAHPERFGGDAADAFDVVAPSLPGFVFSSRPPRPWGPRRMAGVMNQLMTDVLGYDRYLAQGGDWGGAVSTWLGYDHPTACRAIHVNIMIMQDPNGPQSPEEEDWAARFAAKQLMQEGYRTQQGTRPQTLSYAMMDSPVGIAAWILEKFHGWSDIQEDNVESAHSKDTLLTNIMLYIVTRSFNTASWIYYGRREEGGRVLSRDGTRVEVPTAAALFPEELLNWPPRSYAERLYNIERWTEMPRGGHFAALEEPALLLDDLRAFARDVRVRPEWTD
ncbi:MAG: epoxide hydrolase family protein [Pseudomonadota bacterium]